MKVPFLIVAITLFCGGGMTQLSPSTAYAQATQATLLHSLNQRYAASVKKTQLDASDLRQILQVARNADLKQLAENDSLFIALRESESRARARSASNLSDQVIANLSTDWLRIEGYTPIHEINGTEVRRFRTFLLHFYPGLISTSPDGRTASWKMRPLEAILIADIICSLGGVPSIHRVDGKRAASDTSVTHTLELSQTEQLQTTTANYRITHTRAQRLEHLNDLFNKYLATGGEM